MKRITGLCDHFAKYTTGIFMRMGRLSMDYSYAANCGIVDYELKNISIDYLIGEVRVDLISCSGKPVGITINNLTRYLYG